MVNMVQMAHKDHVIIIINGMDNSVVKRRDRPRKKSTNVSQGRIGLNPNFNHIV